jgi:hypothetical protein
MLAHVVSVRMEVMSYWGDHYSLSPMTWYTLSGQISAPSQVLQSHPSSVDSRQLMNIHGVPSIVKLGGATEWTLFLEMNICLHLLVLKFRCLLLIHNVTESTHFREPWLINIKNSITNHQLYTMNMNSRYGCHIMDLDIVWALTLTISLSRRAIDAFARTMANQH